MKGASSKENHKPGSSGGSGRSSMGNSKNGPSQQRALTVTGASIVFKSGTFQINGGAKEAKMEIDESSGESIKALEENKDNIMAMVDVVNVSVEDEATACGDIEMDEVCNEATIKTQPHLSGKDMKAEGKIGSAGISAKFSGPS